MNFDLADDQVTLQETVRDYFASRFPLSRVRGCVERDTGHDEVWRGLMDVGVGAIAVPEAYGGLGLGVLDSAAAMEMIGYSLAPTPILAHVLGTLAVARGGSEAQCGRWLPSFADGSVRVAWVPQFADHADASTPEQVLLDLDATAVLDAADADLLVVGLGGGGLAVVDVDVDGVTIDRLPTIDRTRTLSRVRLANARAQLLPRGGDIVEWLRDVALTLLAADAMGGASRCLEMTVDYVSIREQWGVVVGTFQAVKHQLADLALQVESARGLYWYAAHTLDQGTDTAGTDSARAAALAKAHITERFVDAGRGAVELHGGIGYTWDCDVHFFLKRALVDRAYLGDPIRLRDRVADLSGW